LEAPAVQRAVLAVAFSRRLLQTGGHCTKLIQLRLEQEAAAGADPERLGQTRRALFGPAGTCWRPG